MFVDTNTTTLTPRAGRICSMARPRTYHLPRPASARGGAGAAGAAPNRPTPELTRACRGRP